MTQNQINYQKLLEEQRHDLATEGAQREANAINRGHYERMDSETAKHNRVGEGISWFDTQSNAAYRSRSASTAESRLAEDLRHNIVAEEETERHNRVSESNTRHDTDTRASTADKDRSQNLNLGQQRLELDSRGQWLSLAGSRLAGELARAALAKDPAVTPREIQVFNLNSGEKGVDHVIPRSVQNVSGRISGGFTSTTPSIHRRKS